MGKIIKEVLNENIKKFDKALEAYSDFLQGVPTFTTYYNKDIINSDQDSQLETVTEIIGIESPIKYRKIIDCAIYGIEDIRLALEDGDFGLSSGGGGTGIIPPGSIKPLPNDYFFINYMGEEYRYKVTDVEVSKANGTRFYQITFELVSSDINMEEQVSETVVQQSKFDGLSNKTIILESDFALLTELRECSKELINYYIGQYTNNYFKLPIFNNMYDNCLTQFIYNNKLLQQDNLRGIFFIPAFKETPMSMNIYNGTLFRALEVKEVKTFTFGKFFFNENVKGTQFEYARNNILIYDYTFPNKNLIKENLKEDIISNSTNETITNIIISYFNDEEETIKGSIIDYCRRLDPMDAELNYHLIPVLLFILKKVISSIERDGNRNG